MEPRRENLLWIDNGAQILLLTSSAFIAWWDQSVEEDPISLKTLLWQNEQENKDKLNQSAISILFYYNYYIES